MPQTKCSNRSLKYRKALQQAHIDLSECGATNAIPSRISVRSCSWLGEGAKIKVLQLCGCGRTFAQIYLLRRCSVGTLIRRPGQCIVSSRENDAVSTLPDDASNPYILKPHLACKKLFKQ